MTDASTDPKSMRRWVEEPLGPPSAARRRMRLTRFWLDKGPARSELVSAGQIVITGRAYSERAT